MMKPIVPPDPPAKSEHRSKRSSSLSFITNNQFTDIQAAALDYVAESLRKVSAGALKKYISDRFKISVREARRIISHLVANAELSYTYEYGCSFLEVSLHRPIRIGYRIFLLPPGWEESPAEDSVALRVQPGAAFGCGRHPTTRLALRGLEAVFLKNVTWRTPARATSALDIGTGSGILAIAALKLGIDRAVGIDRDVCARAEAAGNALLNDLETRLVITDKTLTRDFSAAPFTLIMANLRYPTLLNLRMPMAGLLESDGALVLSGIKKEEQAGILKAYAESGLHNWWTKEDKGWASIVLRPGSVA
jgi:ribosomal protein L11 methyltransferase